MRVEDADRTLGKDTFAGITHAQLSVERFDLGRGVILRQTYAHLMSPNLMAFKAPEPGKHHPGPWRAAKGGRGYDIHMEVLVPASAKNPGALSGRDTVWLIAALLRLARYPFLSVPVISDIAFSDAAHSKVEPTLEPFEVQPRIFRASSDTLPEVTTEDLEWLREAWPNTARLMQEEGAFRDALVALDESTFVGRTSAALLAIWGGLEQLFSPSAGELRFRVSSYIAAFLEQPGERRMERYREILKLYDARSRAAHSATPIDNSYLMESFVLMRNVVMKIIADGRTPKQANLERLLLCASQDGVDTSTF